MIERLAAILSVAIVVAGCGASGNLAPKDSQRLHSVMTKGLSPPGEGGVGQAKAAGPKATPPAAGTGN